MFLKYLFVAALYGLLVNGNVYGARSKRQATSKYKFAGEELTIGFLPWLSRDTNNLTPPVSYYQIGPNGRTEVMSALIHVNNLNTGTATNDAARNYARSHGKSNDDAGHILARKLGGSGTDLRNIFPQSPNFNRGVWAQTESMVEKVVRQYGSARFTVNLEYKDRKTTRPFVLVYQIEGGGRIITTNDLVNP